MAEKKITPKNEAVNSDILNEAKNIVPKGTTQEPQDPASSASKADANTSSPEHSSPHREIEEEKTDVNSENVPLDVECQRKMDYDIGFSHGQQAKEEELAESRTKESESQMTAEQAREELQKKNLVKKYGPNPVVAQKGGIQTLFSRIAWDNLKTGKDGTKDGWREVVEVPEEVREFLNQRVKA